MLNIFKKLLGIGSNEELAKLIKDGAYLVDVRTPEEFANGNAKGSVNIPLDKVSNQLSKFNGKEHIIVFCRSGNRSSQAKSILNQNGYTNVTNGGTWKNVNQKIINQKK
jgi:rhodanese-related sulfurtransferase